MADTTPAAVPERPADEAYRPISGWAIAGFAVGAFYSGLVVLTTVIALVRREPFFMPFLFVLVPATGAILSLIAQRQIQNSEGTRIGLGLARWGLILSVVVGVGYSAYSMFTGMALTRQAGDFLMVKSGDDSGFFPRLQESSRDPTELNAAFLLTLPAADRKGHTKTDEANLKLLLDPPSKAGTPGPLTGFKSNSLIRAIAQGSVKDTSIESLGTEQWYYDQGAYHVERRYRITTLEVVYDVLVPVQSSRDSDTGVRKWFVNFPNVTTSSQLPTPLGIALTMMRRKLFGWLHTDWLQRLNRGEALTDFPKMDRTEWSLIVRGNETRQLLQQTVHDLFTSKQPNRLVSLELLRDEVRAPWKHEAGKLILQQDFSLDVVLPNGKRYFLSGHLAARSTTPINLQAPPAAPIWEVVEIKFTHAGMVDSSAGQG